MYADLLAWCVFFVLLDTLVVWETGRTLLRLWPDLVDEGHAVRLAVRAGREAYRRKRSPGWAVRVAGRVWWRLGDPIASQPPLASARRRSSHEVL